MEARHSSGEGRPRRGWAAAARRGARLVLAGQDAVWAACRVWLRRVNGDEQTFDINTWRRSALRASVASTGRGGDTYNTRRTLQCGASPGCSRERGKGERGGGMRAQEGGWIRGEGWVRGEAGEGGRGEAGAVLTVPGYTNL